MRKLLLGVVLSIMSIGLGAMIAEVAVCAFEPPRDVRIPPRPSLFLAHELPYPVPPEPESSKPRRSRYVLRSELDAVKAEVKVLQEQVKRISQYLNETRHQVEI